MTAKEIIANEKSYKAVLPAEALKSLVPAVASYQTLLPARHEESLRQLIRLTLPPPVPGGLAWACQHFLTLTPAGYEHLRDCARALLATLVTTAGEAPGSLPRALAVATRYPVFFGLSQLAEAATELAAKANPSVLAGFYLRVCALAHTTVFIRPSVYYFDVLTVRDVLTESCHQLGLGYSDSLDIATLREALLVNNRDLIEQNAERKRSASSLNQLPPGIPAKLARLNYLLEGAREFGCPVYIDAPRGHGRRGKHQKAEPMTELERIDQVHTVATLNVVGEPTMLAHGVVTEIVETISVPANSAAASSADMVRTGFEFRRKVQAGGSRLAPRDDRYARRGWYNAWQAQGVPSFTDASRLPLPLVVRFLDFLFAKDPLLFAFAWLCETLGLNSERLTELVIVGRRPRWRRGVFLIASRNLLAYELLGGPTDSTARTQGGPSESHVLRTALPYELASILRAAGNPQPFADAEVRLNRLAQQFKGHIAGPAPTASRLNRSYWLHIPPLGLSHVEAAFVAGEIPSRLNAHADYHRLPRHALYVRTVAAVRQFAQGIAANASLSQGLQGWARSLTFPESPKAPGTSASSQVRDFVGSQVPATLVPLAGFFEAVRTAVMAYRDRIARLRPEDRVALLAEVLNLANVQLYVLQEFALGVRPRGGVAVLSYSNPDFGAWVEDKGSAKYREFSLSALPMVVVQQQQYCDEADLALHEYCARQHISMVNERRLHTQQMAAVYGYKAGRDGTPGSLKVTMMTAADYQRCLRDLGLARYCPLRRNELRHATVNHFQDLPAAALTQYVGHHLPGLDMFEPWSSASVRSYFELMREVANYLNALNPIALNIKELV